MPEGDFSKMVKPAINREGLVAGSVIIFTISLLIFLIFNGFWHEGQNMQMFVRVIAAVIAIFLLLGVYVIIVTPKELFQKEVKGTIMFGAGCVIVMLVAIGGRFELLGLGGTIGLIHIILLLLGFGVCVLGIINLARVGGFFLIWFLGPLMYLIEIINDQLVLDTPSPFGTFSAMIAITASVVIGLSFLLYIYTEAKFIYLSTLVQHARELSKDKQYEEAIAELDKAITIYPNYVTAWNNKGNIHFRMKDFEEAKECYDLALEINPDYPLAKSNQKLVHKKLRIKETS